MLTRLLLFGALCCCALPSAARAQDTEIMRGIIRDKDKKPIEGVTVTVLGLIDQRQWTQYTNAKGSYTVIVEPGEGEYIISLRRIGYAPQSIHVIRSGMSTLVVTDAVMTEIPQVLEDKIVNGQRVVTNVTGKSIGGDDKDLLAGALISLDQANLLALAANVPGVLMIPGANGRDSSYSVLGMGGDANNIMVDGSLMRGNTLPSMSVGTASMATNTYDIMRGGYSGGQMVVTTRSGSDVFELNQNLSLTNNHLTWSDPATSFRAPSQIRGSIGGGGPIIKSRLNYFVAMDLGHSTSEVVTLFNASPTVLNQYGISKDTVTAFRNALDAIGVPLTIPGVPNSRVGNNGSASVRFDYRPKAATTLMLSFNGRWERSGGAGYSGVTTTPTTGGPNTNSNFGASMNFNGYVGGVLNTITGSLTHVNEGSRQYLDLPSGSVRVGSVYTDGRTGLTYLRFGGNSGGVNKSTGFSYNLSDQFSIITTNSKHRFKIGGGLNGEHWDAEVGQLGPGSYGYLSLEDVIAGKPAGYNRTLNPVSQTYTSLTGFVGVQDEILASQKLQLSIGVRTDLSRGGNGPTRNPVVDSIFGFRNDVVPTSVGMIPRLGFSWTPTKGNPPKPGANTPPSLTPEQSAAMAQAMAASNRAALEMSMVNGGGRMQIPTGAPPGLGSARLLTITGGIGLQRQVIPSYMIQSLSNATGLPNTSRQLTCVGAATPIPSWDEGAVNAPEQCLDGTGPVTLTSARPSVMMFDPHFKPQARWSANVGVSGLTVRNWTIAASGSYNIGVNMPGSIDMNLRRDTSFTVSNESNRPVFVDAANIVPTSGIMPPNANRIHSEFGSVSRAVSDQRNETVQFQFTIGSPKPLFGKIPFSVNYTWTPYQRSLVRGFAGSGGGFSSGGFEGGFGGGSSNTDGDPFRKEWVPGTQNTHSLNTNTSYRIWWFSLNLRLNLSSGLPYTPMVSGDVNGDGASFNDRAFIFDPAALSDTAFAGQLRSLMAATSPGARRCLQKQLGGIAGRNSCRTAWFLRTDITMSFNPPKTLGFGDRLKFSAGMLNAGSAIVRLAGLENSFLGRSQAQQYPNSTLLYVTGFDPATRQYKYRVNQLFGLPQNFGYTNSRLQPFQIQLGASWKIGGLPRAPMATGLGLVPPGKEPAMTLEEVKSKLHGLTSDPIAPILKLQDSLHLTTDQVQKLQAIGVDFFTQSDSVFAPLAEFIVAKGKKMTDIELNTKLPKARADVTKLLAGATSKAVGELTAAQKALYTMMGAAKKQ